MKASHKILQDIIAFPSVTGDYAANHDAIEYIDRFLSERGMFVKRLEFNGVESLVATTRRTKTPRVMFVGHVDVVTAPPEQFELREEGENFYGRGVIDMKASIAAFMQVIDDLQDDLDTYDLGIMIVSDEETGGFNGAKRLIEEGYLPEMCILPDGGSNSNWALEAFAKGVWFIDIETSGKSTHGSRPWEGENATTALLKTVNDVQQLFPVNGRDTSTCTLSKLHADMGAYNLIPDYAAASFDIRAASIEEDKNIRNAVLAICEAHGATLKESVYAAPTANDMDNPYLRSFADSIEKIIGYPGGTTVSNAGSDGRFFAAQGVPCAIFYPTGGDHHSNEEWISKQAYAHMQEVFRDYLNKEARSQPEHPATHYSRQLEPVNR